MEEVMPRARNLLNVRAILEDIIQLREALRDKPFLPPAYQDELARLAVLARARLQKVRGRKDVYVETSL
jgi:hypothetical protein